MLREDGTGAIEYFYGKMGEVTKTRRTMIVPNQAIATYVTQWTYDSHNRLLEMIYPDEEKITYSYNLGGQLEKVHGYKSYGYDYVSKIGYDKFEQRTYLKYCNGAETFYTYDPQRRRLQNLTVNSGGNTIMDNAYTYDAVSNVLSVVNGASVPQSGKAGGQMAHAYTYDALYRLVSATGTYTGADNKTASYTLAMGYDNMHRITSKRQILTQNNVQFNGTLNAGYDLSYTYGTDTGKKFQLANVKDVNYRTEETPSESENVNNNHAYEYDANGNLENFEFYAMTAHADIAPEHYIKEHFQMVLGKVYHPFDGREGSDQQYYSLALRKPEHVNDAVLKQRLQEENEQVLFELQDAFYVAKCELGTDPRALADLPKVEAVEHVSVPKKFLTMHWLENYQDSSILIGGYKGYEQLNWVFGREGGKRDDAYNVRLGGKDVHGAVVKSREYVKHAKFVILYDFEHQLPTYTFRVKNTGEMSREKMVATGYKNPSQDKYFCYFFDEEITLGEFDIEAILKADKEKQNYIDGRPIYLSGEELIKFRRKK